MVNEFLDEGNEAVVICINEKYLGREFCGRVFDRQFVADLPVGVDACGENGEFHTFVSNCKSFARPVSYRVAEIYHHAPAFPSGETGSFYYARLELG
jgi:diphthamide synthase (EF-2-diphthine--ammonia ligase)